MAQKIRARPRVCTHATKPNTNLHYLSTPVLILILATGGSEAGTQRATCLHTHLTRCDVRGLVPTNDGCSSSFLSTCPSPRSCSRRRPDDDPPPLVHAKKLQGCALSLAATAHISQLLMDLVSHGRYTLNHIQCQSRVPVGPLHRATACADHDQREEARL